MTDRICRWGILGAANIARKNWHAIYNSGNGTLAAVGSRSAERGAEFVRACQSQVAYNPPPKVCAYEEILADPEIDAVYIPLPTGIRKEWVIRAANAGKHVLCEKPCAPTAAEVAEMIEACRKNNVQFMDGVMFMHSARLPQMRTALDDETLVGNLKRIASHFSFYGGEEFHKENIRVSKALEPLGALGDLGWYNLRFTLWAMNYELPQKVSGRTLSATSEGVPLEFSGELFFSGGTSANFYCSFETENQQWAHMSGDKGLLSLQDFVLSFYGAEAAFHLTRNIFEPNVCQYNMTEHTRRVAVREYSNNAATAQESNLFRNFASIVLSGKLENHWPEISLKTQRVLDACLQSANRGGELVSLE